MHARRLVPGIDRYTTVSLAYRVVVIHMMLRREEVPVLQLGMLRLGFLNANDICILPVHPLEKAFVGGSPDAIGVERDYSHPFRAPELCLELRASISKTSPAIASHFFLLVSIFGILGCNAEWILTCRTTKADSSNWP